MKTKFISLIVNLIIFTSACSPASTSLPPSPTIPPASTVPPPTQTPVAIDLPTGSTDYASEEQRAGRYKTPQSFSIPFTFETTEAFRGMAEPLPQGYVFGLGQGSRTLPEKQLLFWILAPDISTEAAISVLREPPYPEYTPNEPATVAGISGTRFDIIYLGEGRLGIPLGPLVGVGDRQWTTNSRQVHLRLIVLAYSGQTMLIYIEAPENEFEDFMMKANQVLDTIQFTEASFTP